MKTIAHIPSGVLRGRTLYLDDTLRIAQPNLLITDCVFHSTAEPYIELDPAATGVTITNCRFDHVMQPDDMHNLHALADEAIHGNDPPT